MISNAVWLDIFQYEEWENNYVNVLEETRDKNLFYIFSFENLYCT